MSDAHNLPKGVKAATRSFITSCPQFKPQKNFAGKHNKLVKKLKDKLASCGFVCETESSIKIEGRAGRIDLSCERGHNLYVIEVKGFERRDPQLFHLTDILQLTSYALALNKKRDVIKAILLYRDDVEHLLKLDNPSKCSAFLEKRAIRYEDYKELVEELLNAPIPWGRIIGPYCLYCVNYDRCFNLSQGG
ncbi:hypothetical protein IPA_03225 [Ignicoccus pacificus DSM 13166]|uniref:Uncharacterized protein n=1 Tax=Ignicoccus pacificus DSM 13166 TaxID=940294 RepID=A0A977KCD7_9CREN|nr:hypothetical protein IPA_03225 [Ignicoccus pacificus DSM 13166]